MNQRNSFENQFVVSYELLQLLEWLLLYEQDALKKLVVKCLEQGLHQQIAQSTRHSTEHIQKAGETMKQSVVDFFALLETLMVEIKHENSVKDSVSRLIIPALDHMDTRLYDPESMARSLAKAQNASHREGKNAEEVLYKELLKRWKPTKKASFN